MANAVCTVFPRNLTNKRWMFFSELVIKCDNPQNYHETAEISMVCYGKKMPAPIKSGLPELDPRILETGTTALSKSEVFLAIAQG